MVLVKGHLVLGKGTMLMLAGGVRQMRWSPLPLVGRVGEGSQGPSAACVSDTRGRHEATRNPRPDLSVGLLILWRAMPAPRGYALTFWGAGTNPFTLRPPVRPVSWLLSPVGWAGGRHTCLPVRLGRGL